MDTRLVLPLEHSLSRGYAVIPFPVPTILTLATRGNMRETKRRIAMLREVGFDPGRVLLPRQEHSKRVLLASDIIASTADHGPDDRVPGDGIVTGPDGPALAVGVGDCMPILLYDQVTGARGLLHSGWKGTGILEAGVDRLRERFGAKARDLIVHLGPCISAASYVVDEERATEYRRWGPDAVVYRQDRPYLDLRAANIAIARRLGIRHVSYADHCTFADERLGSFRRQGHDYAGMLVVSGEPHEGLQERDA